MGDLVTALCFALVLCGVGIVKLTYHLHDARRERNEWKAYALAEEDNVLAVLRECAGSITSAASPYENRLWTVTINSHTGRGYEILKAWRMARALAETASLIADTSVAELGQGT